MQAYLLWWDNDQEYDDREVTLLGVYSSAEERERAKAEYLSARFKGVWPFLGGGFDEAEVVIDESLIRPPPPDTGR